MKIELRFWDESKNDYVDNDSEWILDKYLDCYKWDPAKNQYEWDDSVKPRFSIKY